MKQFPLEDRVVVVIGGTTGLGLSAARACLRAGAAVVACGRSAESVAVAQDALGDRARVFAGDATDPNTATEAIRRAIADFGRFDALYHVAGGSGRQAGDGPLHEITDAGIEATLRLNLVSLMYSNRAAARSLMERGVGGSVLNMGSVLGFSPSPEFFATHVYAAAKSAIIGFTKSCAAYYAPHNIRFNRTRARADRHAHGSASGWKRGDSAFRESQAAARWRPHRQPRRSGCRGRILLVE